MSRNIQSRPVIFRLSEDSKTGNAPMYWWGNCPACGHYHDTPNNSDGDGAFTAHCPCGVAMVIYLDGVSESLEGWDFFHRNAGRVAHINEQHYRYGGLICPDCQGQPDADATVWNWAAYCESERLPLFYDIMKSGRFYRISYHQPQEWRAFVDTLPIGLTYLSRHAAMAACNRTAGLSDTTIRHTWKVVLQRCGHCKERGSAPLPGDCGRCGQIICRYCLNVLNSTAHCPAT